MRPIRRHASRRALRFPWITTAALAGAACAAWMATGELHAARGLGVAADGGGTEAPDQASAVPGAAGSGSAAGSAGVELHERPAPPRVAAPEVPPAGEPGPDAVLPEAGAGAAAHARPTEDAPSRAAEDERAVVLPAVQ